MRQHKGWTTLEYCWRFGVRPLMWVVRVAVMIWAAGTISFALDYVSDLGALMAVVIYGIYEIGRSIRSIQPLNVNIAKGDVLTVESGATVSVPTQDIERVIAHIATLEARRQA